MEKTLKKYFPLFVLPTLAAFIIGFIVPFAEGIYLSFCKFSMGATPSRWAFHLCQRFSDATFRSAFWFTLGFTAVSTILINVLAFAIALLLTRGIKGTNVFRTVFFMPNLIGGIVLDYIWQILINCVLSLVKQPLLQLNTAAGYWGLIILMCWQQVGYMMIIYIAGLQNVPGDLIEAAQIDGANPWQALVRIKLPMVMSSVTICLFLSLTNSFKLFDQNLSLTGGEPNHASDAGPWNIHNIVLYPLRSAVKCTWLGKGRHFLRARGSHSPCSAQGNTFQGGAAVMVKAKKGFNLFWTVLLSVASVLYVYPILMILLNSFKRRPPIAFLRRSCRPADTFAGAANYVNAISIRAYRVLEVRHHHRRLSVALILLCCSMCAWYITRVNSLMSKAMYYLCVFSMVVPFQMVMFTLSQTADSLGLNKPSNIAIIYLGFGAGLAVFMFCGFVKSIPLEIEEAAMIDGCNPIQTYFRIVFPIFKPTMISVAILEAMWVWNDYLLPTLVLDIKKYRTIPMLIQYFRGSYGRVEMGPMMACIMLTVLPIIILYLACQKYIIEGVVAGAVKG